jgi:phosphomannomutase
MDISRVLNEIISRYKNYRINTTDGVRIDFDNEWVHLRRSNTEPVIRIISESDMESKSEMLAKKIISDIREIISAKEEA